MANEIADKVCYPLINVGKSVDDIREMIKTSYEQVNPVIYLIADADDLSLNASNSLLKVIEEPPNNAYFVMTLKQIQNTLPTIRSRSYEFMMQSYSYQEISQMIHHILPNCSTDDFVILEKFNNYWQIKTVAGYGIVIFYNFVLDVFNNIHKMKGADSFKFSQQLDLKNDGKGFDLELFFTLYSFMCFHFVYDDAILEQFDDYDMFYTKCLYITHKYKKLLNVKGANKQFVVDGWLLDIRKEWLSNEAK